jgi:hypothetical protein
VDPSSRPMHVLLIRSFGGEMISSDFHYAGIGSCAINSAPSVSVMSGVKNRLTRKNWNDTEKISIAPAQG